ncbi:MAG: hypothetical protein IJY14_02240 [Acholeplasmatales bacterium]|nr:hypothetical protein [Acholeplasmatales bacterium]
MQKEKILEYSNKYKKIAYRISVVAMIFLVLLGLAFFGVGCWLCILREGTVITIVGTIMIVAGMLDIYFSIKFIRFTKDNLKYMNDKKAAGKYCKIMGIK